MIVGISTDGLSDQARFASKEKLDFALMADADRQAARAFGVLMARNPKYCERITFVIDKQGVIRKIYAQVDVTNHPEEVLAYIKGL